MSPLWMGTSKSSVFWERWGHMTLISFWRSRSIWFRSSPPENKQLTNWKTNRTQEDNSCIKCESCVCRVLMFLLTSGYLYLQGRADEGHEGGGEVDRHVIVHRHVHQHQPLRANEDRWTEGDRRRRYFYVRVFISLNTSDQGWEDSVCFFYLIGDLGRTLFAQAQGWGHVS